MLPASWSRSSLYHRAKGESAGGGHTLPWGAEAYEKGMLPEMQTKHSGLPPPCRLNRNSDTC